MAYKAISISDNGECQRCGKTNLKMTVVVVPVDSDGTPCGVEEHWGRDCAAYAIYGKKSPAMVQRIEADVRREQEARKHQEDMWRRRIATDATSVWHEHVPMGIHAYRTEAHTIVHRSVREAANVKFMNTGLRPPGSFLMSNAQGHEVRVMPSRAGEVEFYTSLGFSQATTIVAA